MLRIDGHTSVASSENNLWGMLTAETVHVFTASKDVVTVTLAK